MPTAALVVWALVLLVGLLTPAVSYLLLLRALAGREAQPDGDQREEAP